VDVTETTEDIFNVTDSTPLASALSSIRDSENYHFTITVGADMSLAPQDLTSAGYKGKTIVLKGDTPARAVSLASKGSLFTVGEDVTLELEDIVLQGQSSNNKSLVEVNSDGTLMMNSGSKISGNKTSSHVGGGVYVDGGTFTMNSGEISGNTSSYGGGVFVDGGTFTMNGGEISGNTSFHGGGVLVNNSTFTMSGGEISGNTSVSIGGGVYVYNSGTFTKQSGGIIYGSNANTGLKNTASGDSSGHAVYISSSKKRNTTAGVGVTLDSTKDGTAGGWE
jgi:hypothetical protein